MNREKAQIIAETQERLAVQRSKILEELQDAKGEWVSVFQLCLCSRALNHTARISQLRNMGYNIERNGDRRKSKYRIVE